MTTLHFHYDIASPYSYLAATQVEAIAADCKATVVWKPTLLGAVFKATGNAPPANLPARARYLLQDLGRWSAYYGVPLNFPMANFPINTIVAMRALTAADDDAVPELTHRLNHAYWVDGQDVSQAAVVADLVGQELVDKAQTQPVKDALRAVTDAAIARGMFGAPTYYIGDQMFFGNDRLPFVEQALRDARNRAES